MLRSWMKKICRLVSLLKLKKRTFTRTMFIVEKIAVATPRLIAITIKAFNRLLESYFEAAAFRLFRVYSRLDVMTMSQDNEAAP